MWDASAQCLWWVDIKSPTLFRRVADGRVSRWVPPMRIGAVAPTLQGGLIAATEAGFFRIDPEADLYLPIAHPEPHLPGNRANDGKVDRQGRFWAGTMDDAEVADSGRLYSLALGMQPMLADSGYRVTNGPAFSPAGDILYATDSARSTIFAFDLAAGGVLSGKRIFARFQPGDGYPDGMTVDSEGCLWVAFWDGWCVRRLSAAGDILAEIAMPVQRPTSCTFGGAGLDTLFITSARIGLDAEALARQPLAGGLFALRPDVIGIADTPFGGSPPPTADRPLP